MPAFAEGAAPAADFTGVFAAVRAGGPPRRVGDVERRGGAADDDAERRGAERAEDRPERRPIFDAIGFCVSERLVSASPARMDSVSLRRPVWPSTARRGYDLTRVQICSGEEYSTREISSSLGKGMATQSTTNVPAVEVCVVDRNAEEARAGPDPFEIPPASWSVPSTGPLSSPAKASSWAVIIEHRLCDVF